MVLPLFFLVLAGFLFYFQLMTLQLRLASGLEQTGQQIAKVYHLDNVIPDIFFGKESGDEEGIGQKIKEYGGELVVFGLTGVFLKNALLEYAGEDFLDESCIKNGSDGMICFVLAEEQTLELRVTYQVTIPFLPGEYITIPVTQRVVRRMWVGVAAEPEADNLEEPEAEEAQVTVYVTRYGTVYHLYRSCSALKRSIRSCGYASIGQQRNNQGACYEPCSQCIRGNANAIVYVTLDGRRYHNSISCQALQRYIEEIPVEEAGDKRLCSYCRKRQEEEHGALE